MMFSPITIVIVLCLFVSLTPSLRYFFFLAPVDRQGQSQGAADIISQVCSKKDISSTSHLFLWGEMERGWVGAACMERPMFSEWGQAQHLSGPKRLSSLLLFFLLNWALALVLSPYLTLTLCDLTLLVLSWPYQQWNFRLIYETKNCIHRLSLGSTVPALKDHSGLGECTTVHRGCTLNLNYTSAQTASLKHKWRTSSIQITV